ncbi:hypothetical protein [Pelagibius sp.]|uniref:hypothetical protein n=1 Tax=Pelagibius sp. TaxID=1931238 RepID=UPI003BB096AC
MSKGHPTISDIDIYRSASILIREHGKDAGLEAASRADALMEKGDVDGQRTWKRILAAVEELQKTAPAPDDTIQ